MRGRGGSEKGREREKKGMGWKKGSEDGDGIKGDSQSDRLRKALPSFSLHLSALHKIYEVPLATDLSLSFSLSVSVSLIRRMFVSFAFTKCHAGCSMMPKSVSDIP